MRRTPRIPLVARFIRPSSSQSFKVNLHSLAFQSLIRSNTFSATLPTLVLRLICTNSPSTSNLSIGKSVISRCSHLWEHKVDTFADNSSLPDILKEYSHLSPETTRRFWRVLALRPNDFLEILLGFGSDVEDLRRVGFLWNFFRWARKQYRDFRHLPRSFEIMSSMLVRAQRFKDAESLLLSEEAEGVFCGDGWMFSEIIRGYAENSLLEDSIALYDEARERGLGLSSSCYKTLLNLLIRMEKSNVVVRVYNDMIEAGLASSCDGYFLEFVVGALSKKGKTLEALNMLRRARRCSVELSPAALNAVIKAYCTKKEYEDILIFLKEWNHIPEACLCNKIVSSLCRKLGVEEGRLFLQKLEDLGFQLDPTTYSILISHSCHDRKLRYGLIYLSESCSRGITLEVHAYNALISGLFKEGMHNCTKEIFDEMVEKSLSLGISTFKVMLAGYCKYRKFNEAKQVLAEMVICGVISLSPVDDALCKIFEVLGIDHLGVKVKRDNTLGLAKAEFFDSLGNGFYLETDIDEYDRILEEILENGIVPAFDNQLLEECHQGNIETALRVKDEAAQWGIDLPLSTYSKLVEGLCALPSEIKRMISFLDEIPELLEQLGHDTLNLLIRFLSKNTEITRARLILDRLLKRKMLIENETYTALLFGLCRENDIGGLQECLEAAQSNAWLPGFKDIEELIGFLCKLGLIKEVLELFDSLTENFHEPIMFSVICNAIVKELCNINFSSIGYMLVEEFLLRGHSANAAAYTSLIGGLLKNQRFAEVLDMIDHLLKKKITPNASLYQLIVPVLFEFDRLETALTFKQDILNSQLKHTTVVYNTLINEFCRRGKMKEAAFQLHEMLVNRVHPDNNTLLALIQGYFHVNDSKRALAILSFMLRNNIVLSVPGYRSLIRQFCGHGQVLRALSLKELMPVKSEEESLVLQNILIFYLFQSGNSLLVEAILKKMLQKHLNPNQDTCNFMIYGFFKCGKIFRSVELLNTMISDGMKPSNRSLRTVICHFCSNGDVDKALELSKLMEINGWKHGSVVLNALIDGIFSCGGTPVVRRFLNQIEGNNMIAKNINLDLPIKKLCVHGSIDMAVHLMNMMLSEGNCPSEISYNLVVKGLSIQKAFDQALDFNAEMLYRNLKPSLDSCDTLICGLCDNGRTDDARKILAEMLRFGPVPTSAMYNYVIDKYYSENNLNKASELLHEMQQVGYSPKFEIYWSLISNLSVRNKKGEDDDDGGGFLSRLLSANGLPAKSYKE